MSARQIRADKVQGWKSYRKLQLDYEKIKKEQDEIEEKINAGMYYVRKQKEIQEMLELERLQEEKGLGLKLRNSTTPERPVARRWAGKGYMGPGM